jgi:hypothetical protein
MPGLILVRPAKESEQIAGLAATVRQTAGYVDVPLIKTYRAERGNVVGERWHGPVQFLRPSDAYDLYRRLHRRRVLVIGFTEVHVRTDPSRDPAVRRAAITLSTFVEHKADFELVRDKPAIQPTLERFKRAIGGVPRCDGEDDPRCLPLHVFAVVCDWSSLTQRNGRDRFEDRYGRARSRVDSGNKRWARADSAAYHGGDALTVAECQLRSGMHWDVSSERGRKKLMNSHEVWELPRQGAGGYVNVHPDAHVGGGSGARRVWTLGGPKGRP